MRASLAANLLYFPVTRVAGEPVRRFFVEYKKHDELSSDELASLQAGDLKSILSYALQRSSHYRDACAKGDGPSSSFADLVGLPLLDKSTLRDRPMELVASGGRRPFEKKTTSGSTGQPVTVWKDRAALARERAATWRAYAWAGIPVAAPQALLWGRALTRKGRFRAALLDFVANRRRLPMFGVTEESFEHYYSGLLRFRPIYLYGYVSAIKAFVEFLELSGKSLPTSVRALITTSELLDGTTRAFLEGRTGLLVFNEYGCGEVGSIAHDCEMGKLHIMSDNLALECIPSPDLPDGLGELVVTDLFNRAMPLVRYRLGDLGKLSAGSCECGRPYPVLERIVGRAYDMIHDLDGRTFHPEAVLYVFEQLRRTGIQLPPYQAIQSEVGYLSVLVQSRDPIRPNDSRAIAEGLRSAFGGRMKVEIAHVDTLAREPSGKLRVVKKIR